MIPASDFETVLAELEAVTVQLLQSDPHELLRLRGLLERRQSAASQVAGQLNRHTEAAGVERTRQVWEKGREMEERLRLVRAATRLQLQELYRVNCHLRALASSGASAPPASSLLSSLDLQA